jgi:hypothetical protein
VLYENPEEEIADKWFGFVNDVVGVLALSFAATALQFDKPAPFAAIFFAILFVWMFSRSGEYRKIAKHYIARYKGLFGTLALMWRLNIYLVGYLALILVATGKITKESVYAVWPF